MVGDGLAVGVMGGTLAGTWVLNCLGADEFG